VTFLSLPYFSVTQGNGYRLEKTFKYVLRNEEGVMIHLDDDNSTIQNNFTLK
jgi:hypothetical protein